MILGTAARSYSPEQPRADDGKWSGGAVATAIIGASAIKGAAIGALFGSLGGGGGAVVGAAIGGTIAGTHSAVKVALNAYGWSKLPPWAAATVTTKLYSDRSASLPPATPENISKFLALLTDEELLRLAKDMGISPDLIHKPLGLPTIQQPRSVCTDGNERRAAITEIRAQGRRLEGYAALFNTEARIGSFRETIKAGAFSQSLTGRDVIALVDHDPSRVLARTRSRTLRLSEDTRGLAFDLDVPDTQSGRDILALAERSDLGGMSFGFSVPKGGDHWTGDLRELRSVTLHEVSVVAAWPAYDGTVVSARARTGSSPRLALASRYLETLRD